MDMSVKATQIPLSVPRSAALDSLDEFDAERSQAVVRIAVAFIVIAYILLCWLYPLGEPLSRDRALLLVGYYTVAFMAVALALYVHVLQRPGRYPARRWFAMTLDYSSLAITMIMGGEPMLPLFALVLWVTVGNGLRFGRTYLVSASGMAQATIITTTVLTPYWRDHPNLVITLSLSALIVPAYAFSLLRKMEEARQTALEANTAKSRFLAQASHDLRQPVHAIGLFIASLRQTNLNQPQQMIVDRIDRSLQGVARLFRSLLDISTLDSGSVVPKPELVVISQLFNELAQQNHDSAVWFESDLRFVSSKQAVVADRALLTTMVQNLISNALKHAPGTPVLVGCRRRGNTLSLHVLDQGAGISADHIPHLCEEFYQVRKLGDPDTQGVGLGLSIVERMARLMGFTVEIKSKVHQGTTVAIHGIPVWSGDGAQLPARVERNFRTPLKGMKIVLVEDDCDVLEATEELLTSWGCDVKAYANIPDSSVECDLIIVDFDIGGGVTGAHCIAVMREACGLTLPAIVMTGHDEMRVSEQLSDPEIPILKKPIRPAELRSMIAAIRLRSQSAV